MSEYVFIDISQLGNRTAASNSDIMLIRSTGGIDSNISIEAFLKVPLKGVVEMSLSNYDSDAAPVVKSGAVFENNGVGLLLSGDATPTGYAGITISTRFYLIYDESASAFIYTETAPTWSDALQGWYNGTDRYFFSMFKDSGGTLYQNKSFLLSQSVEKSEIHPTATRLEKTGNYIHSAGVTYAVLFDMLAPSIPNTGNKMKLGGGYQVIQTSRVDRTSATQMVIYGTNSTGSITTITLTSGSGTSTLDISLAW